MRLCGKLPPKREATELVMRVLRSSQEGMTSQEIYRRVVELRPPPQQPPEQIASSKETEMLSEYPIHSMR